MSKQPLELLKDFDQDLQPWNLVHDLHLHSDVGMICVEGSKIRLCSGNGDGTTSHQSPDRETSIVHEHLELCGKNASFFTSAFFKVTYNFLLLNKRERTTG